MVPLTSPPKDPSVEQKHGPYPLPGNQVTALKKYIYIYILSEILPFPVIGKQSAACSKNVGKAVDLCWKNQGGPVNPPHTNIKTRKKSRRRKREKKKRKKKTWRRKIYERSPCAGNLRKKREKKITDRKLYSEPQILVGLQELQPDVSWAENTETCCKLCLHYSAEPLWERHRAPDSSSSRRRRRRDWMWESWWWRWWWWGGLPPKWSECVIM